MGDAAVVAGGLHAVMRAQRLVAGGQVRHRLVVHVTERRRERVAAVFRRRATQAPQRILQATRQGDEALAAEHHFGVHPAGEGEAEMVEPVRQLLPGDTDAKPAGVGEVRQALGSRGVVLAEDHVPLGPVQRLPGADAAFQGAADTFGQRRMAAAHLVEQGDRPQTWHRHQHRHDLALPNHGQRIRPPAATRCSLLGGRSGIAIKPAAGAGAEPGPSGGGLLRESLTE